MLIFIVRNKTVYGKSSIWLVLKLILHILTIYHLPPAPQRTVGKTYVWFRGLMRSSSILTANLALMLSITHGRGFYRVWRRWLKVWDYCVCHKASKPSCSLVGVMMSLINYCFKACCTQSNCWDYYVAVVTWHIGSILDWTTWRLFNQTQIMIFHGIREDSLFEVQGPVLATNVKALAGVIQFPTFLLVYPWSNRRALMFREMEKK